MDNNKEKYSEPLASTLSSALSSALSSTSLASKCEKGDDQTVGVYYEMNNAEQCNAANRQGHLFCSKLCDTRRAILFLHGAILGCTHLLLALSTLSGIISNLHSGDAFLVQIGRDAKSEYFMESIVPLLCDGFAIYGAWKYHLYSMIAAVILDVVLLIANTLPILKTIEMWSRYPDLELTVWNCMVPAFMLVLVYIGLTLYPDCVFLYQVHKGIMSRENYVRNERFSICCFSPHSGPLMDDDNCGVLDPVCADVETPNVPTFDCNPANMTGNVPNCQGGNGDRDTLYAQVEESMDIQEQQEHAVVAAAARKRKAAAKAKLEAEAAAAKASNAEMA